SDDDHLQVRPVQVRFRHQISDLLVPFVDRDVMAPLESARALTAHPMLRRDLRLEVLDHLDSFSAEQAERGLAPVDYEEPVDVLLREHLVQGLRVELRVATIQERDHGFRRVEYERDDVRLDRTRPIVSLSAGQAERGLASVDYAGPVDVLLREPLVQGLRVELRVATIQERDHGFRRLEYERDHLRLIRTDLFVSGEEDEAVRRGHLV